MILTFKQVSTRTLPFLLLKKYIKWLNIEHRFLEKILENDVEHDRINCAQKKNPQKGSPLYQIINIIRRFQLQRLILQYVHLHGLRNEYRLQLR